MSPRAMALVATRPLPRFVSYILRFCFGFAVCRGTRAPTTRPTRLFIRLGRAQGAAPTALESLPKEVGAGLGSTDSRVSHKECPSKDGPRSFGPTPMPLANAIKDKIINEEMQPETPAEIGLSTRSRAKIYMHGKHVVKIVDRKGKFEKKDARTFSDELRTIAKKKNKDLSGHIVVKRAQIADTAKSLLDELNIEAILVDTIVHDEEEKEEEEQEIS